jgi:hypothetical protein
VLIPTKTAVSLLVQVGSPQAHSDFSLKFQCASIGITNSIRATTCYRGTQVYDPLKAYRSLGVGILTFGILQVYLVLSLHPKVPSPCVSESSKLIKAERKLYKPVLD